MRTKPTFLERAVVLAVLTFCLSTQMVNAADQNGQHGSKPGAKMSAKAREMMNAGGLTPVNVIVLYNSAVDQAETARLKGLGGTNIRRFENFPMQSLRVPAPMLEHVSRGKGVKFVAMDAPVQGLSAAARETARFPEPGSVSHVPVDSSLAVAVLDSGVSAHTDITVTSRLDCTVPSQGGSGTLLDEFSSVSYSGDAGSSNWSGSWIETNDDGSAASGTVRIEAARLFMDNSDGSSLETISRTADLSGATAATLSFDYDGYGAGGLDIVTVEVSDDGGYSFVPLEDLEVVGNINDSRSYNLSDQSAAAVNSRLRFRIGQGFAGAWSVRRFRQRPDLPHGLLQRGGQSAVRGWRFLDEFSTTSYAGNDGDFDWSRVGWRPVKAMARAAATSACVSNS